MARNENGKGSFFSGHDTRGFRESILDGLTNFKELYKKN